MRSLRLLFFAAAVAAPAPFLFANPSPPSEPVSGVLPASEPLPLDGYLSEVRRRNDTYRGWLIERDAAAQRERRKELVTSPSAFANAELSRDEKLPTFPVFVYDRYDTRYYSAGVEGLTRFGLKAKLSYEMDYTGYVGVNDPAFAGVPLTFYDARPVVELTQSLWRNFGGRGTRAEIDAISSEARAAWHEAEAELRRSLADAEVAYWDLAIAREAIAIQETALKAAEGIHDYTVRRARMNLGDKADALQSAALLEARRLQLKSARDAERSAARRFNALRNAPPDEPVPELFPLSWAVASASGTIEGRRADVQAAEARAELTAANARRQADADRPMLEAFGSYALNGRDDDSSGALSDSYEARRPTAVAGVRFSVPLDLGALASARRGALRQSDAAKARAEQAKADERSDKIDLAAAIADARERLRLAGLIEAAQRKKLEHERGRLRQGRTSTYQVLLFEQEYSEAELARVRAGRTLLELLARRRLYSPA